MLHIHCTGTPYQIGLTHGSSAKPEISRSITFYASLFQKNSNLSWPSVLALASSTFLPRIASRWPAFHSELRGIADGANRPLSEIVALNVRTEIAFGLAKEAGAGSSPWIPSDGCTALAYMTPPTSSSSSSGGSSSRVFLAQNWDWQSAQRENLVDLTIELSVSPPLTIRMVTEAGILGKIGFNSAGVGVCLNAIKGFGVDPERVPCHLGLRAVLESRSREEALRRLSVRADVDSSDDTRGFDPASDTYGSDPASDAHGCDRRVGNGGGGDGGGDGGSGGKGGVASASHFLIASPTGATGVEWSSKGYRFLEMDDRKRILAHTNHYLLEPDFGVVHEKGWLPDSAARVSRMEELCGEMEGETEGKSGGPAVEVGIREIQRLFGDEEGAPAGICRAGDERKGEGDTVETLFNIVMELSGPRPRAEVIVGRPVKGGDGERFEMDVEAKRFDG